MIQAETTNSFDTAGRLSVVGNGPAKATYSYLANSPLVEQITFANDGTAAMTTKRTYDYLNRLTSIQSLNAQSSTLNSFVYDYNSANHRTLRREADGAYWRYEYDSLGQVKSGKRYWVDGTPVAGQQFEYGFDDIGNRTAAKAGGDEFGSNLRRAAYTADMLNRYVSRTNAGAVDVMGVALATNTVTVNTAATYRKGEYFRKQLTVDNSAGPVWQGVSISAPGETAVTRHEFVPPAQETFAYDLDGSLTQDARWNYTWDAENRLVRMEARSGAWPQQWLAFEYDWRGRRTARNIGPIGSGTATNSVRFVYDGWNLLAVLSTQSAVLQSFLWGLDLSGSLQGAGGVGGLLAVYDSANGTHFPAFDGNGNVVALVNAGDGTLSAQYEYGPFGEVLRATGTMATANPFRFSTKCQDDETGLLYYGYRYHDPSTGRWLSRDPIQEAGHRVLDHASRGKQEKLRTNSARSLDSSLYRKQSCDSGTCSGGPGSYQSAPGGGVDLFDYQFCYNDPMNLFDADGRKVPFLICQYYVLQGGVGIALGFMEKYVIKRRCEDLADTPDQESFGRSPGSRMLTLVNISAVIVQCGPCGGQVYLHVWFDDELNCKWDYVIICNECSA